MKKLLSSLMMVSNLVFVSQAQEWENLNPGGGGQIQGITLDPNTPGRMFLNSDVEGNYRSNDYGLSWTYTGKDLIHHMSFVTAVEPGNSNRVYCGGIYGLSLSINGGLNWSIPNWPMKGSAVATLVVDPSNANNIYAGNSWYIKDTQIGNQKVPVESTTGTRNIWITKDKGNTWQTINYEPVNGYKQCYTITIDPTNNSRIYLGAHSGLYKSTNGGTSFSKISFPSGMASCRGFDITPNGQFAYAVFTADETVLPTQTNVYVAQVNNSSNTWTWSLIASPTSSNGLYYASGVSTYYWKPMVDPRSTATQHKVILGCMSSNANSSQGLFEYTGAVNSNSVSGSWAMVFGQSGTNSFNYDMGWNAIAPQVRQYAYTPTSWPSRKVLIASQQSLYFGDPALANNTLNKYQVLSTEYIGTSGSYRTYKTRGFQSTVNFDGTGYRNYVAQGMADNRILESWDSGNSWTQESRPNGGQNCDYVDIIPANGSNPALVITAAGGGFGGVNDAADASHWGKYLSNPASPNDAWVSLETGTSGLPTANSRTYGSTYNPQDFKNVIIATQNGLYETKDIYARMAGTGGTFTAIGPVAVSFKSGDVWFSSNGNVLFACTNNTLYKATRNTITGSWSFNTVTTSPAITGNFTYWVDGSTTYMSYSNGENVYLSVNEGPFSLILNRAQTLAINTEPWLGTWTNGDVMDLTFSGIAGYKKQIVLGSHVEDGKHGYCMLRGTINANNTVTWENWSGTFGTPNFMEVARLWDGKIVVQPKADNTTGIYYYAATRGAGLWRRELPTTTSSNVAPTVSITSPSNGTTFTQGATINLQANASDSDGNITKVEFFNGVTKLGEDLSTPYTYSWANVTSGNYTITAKATDNSGATTTSSAINIIVNAAYRYLRLTGLSTVTNDVTIQDITWLAGANTYPNPKLSTDNGAVTANVGTTPWRAFDTSLTSGWVVLQSFPATITVDLGSGVAVAPTGIQIDANSANRGFGSFECYGSNDNTTWTLLYSVSGLTSADYPSSVGAFNFESNGMMNSFRDKKLILESNSSDLSLYPNPTSGLIRINLANHEVAKVKVYNLVGKLIYQGETNLIDLSKEADGIYLFQVEHNDMIENFKIILKH
ncbi:Ig-like domain-containing protein [Pedobacter glucosidilyticus]|uniref:Ig-like domain-containing protein n=1 Tax=Pedobacter glucosidilyticus TaxID=1122941 RepID=UPI0004255C0D|nr:Ig-like domain-containing protein [Pedobacter glucosidilyticus]